MWKYPAHRKNITFIRVLIQKSHRRFLKSLKHETLASIAVKIFWFGIWEKERDEEIRRKKKKKKKKKREGREKKREGRGKKKEERKERKEKQKKNEISTIYIFTFSIIIISFHLFI